MEIRMKQKETGHIRLEILELSCYTGTLTGAGEIMA